MPRLQQRMNGPLPAVMIGAGGRGQWAYGPHQTFHPEDVRWVAVAEPDAARRARFGDDYDVPGDRRFTSWEELVRQAPPAQVAVNATMDQTHHASTLALLKAGYHVLLEKPMATTPEQCLDLLQAARGTDRVVQVCHVLRYAPFYRSLHDVVQSGRLGEIFTFDWAENVSFWHFAHSFVRGRWGNSDSAAPMLLAKCCHDLDQIVWILDRPARRVSSFGARRYFRPETVGPEIPDRCIDGCPIAEECPFYAPRFYLHPEEIAFLPPTSAALGLFDTVSMDHRPEALLEALKTGPYGRCVFRSDNNVVDRQTVMIDFGDGLVANLKMHGGSHLEGRTMRIDGSRATLLGNEPRQEITVLDHRTGQVESVPVPAAEPGAGHGGGDRGVMQGFLAAVRGDKSQAISPLEVSVDSHMIAFAAEESRLTGRTVEMREYLARFRNGGPASQPRADRS